MSVLKQSVVRGFQASPRISTHGPTLIQAEYKVKLGRFGVHKLVDFRDLAIAAPGTSLDGAAGLSQLIEHHSSGWLVATGKEQVNVLLR